MLNVNQVDFDSSHLLPSLKLCCWIAVEGVSSTTVFPADYFRR